MVERPTDKELNAYVDAELSPQDDARVAQAIAQDPSLAARVASLTRLKSTLSVLTDDLPRPSPLPDPRRSIRWLSVAASAAILLVAGIVLSMTSSLLGPEDDGWYREAVAEHKSWALTPAAPDAPKVDANLFLAGLEELGLPVQTPDLSSAGLRLTYLQVLPSTDKVATALHLGYTGRHGCKVTLWATAAPAALGIRPIESRDGDLRGFRWRSGETAYALFATGMAEGRFAVIVDKVYEATQRRRGFDAETRMALRRATTDAPPCRA